MSEPLRNTAPAIDFLLWQSVNIIGNFLVGNQHKVHLTCATTITLFCEILKHLCVADRCLRDIGFKVLTELIVYDIYTRITERLQCLNHALIQLYNIKSNKRIKGAACCQARINAFKLLIRFDVIIFQARDKRRQGIRNFILELLIGIRKIFFPAFNNRNSRLIIRFRHDVQQIIFL